MENLPVTLLTIAEVIVSVLLVLIVLMQRPRQEGLGASFGEGVTNQVWGAQTTNVLQKGTAWLGIILFVLALVLAALIARENGKAGKPSLIGEAAKNAPVPAAPAPAPAAPALTPAAPSITPAAPVVTPAPVAAKPAADAKAAPAPAAAPKADAKAAPAPAATPAPTTPAPAVPTAPAAPAGQPK